MAAVSHARPKPSPNVSIFHYFGKLKDPRRDHRKLHDLQDILFIAVCAVLAGAKDWQEVVTFAQKRLDWLKRFIALENGIPSHDTFERVFDRINPAAFQRCFRQWVQAIQDVVRLKHIAIDGKTLCGSRSLQLGPLHMVSAWATAQSLSLGQVAVADKSNEITAIPALLDLLDIHGALVTIDAMGCQKAIAQKIVDGGGDYLLTVKDNQPHLLEDIQHVMQRGLDSDFAGLPHSIYETQAKGHGREEYRRYTVVQDTSGVRHVDEWKGLTTLGMCYSERKVGDTVSHEIRYFIGSRQANAKTYGQALRNHWGIENKLHWQLDVAFREDSNRVSKRHAAENLALIRRLNLSLLQAHPAKMSIAKKQFAAALDPEFLEEILSGESILEKQ